MSNATQTRYRDSPPAAPSARSAELAAKRYSRTPRLYAIRRAPELALLGWLIGLASATLSFGTAWLAHETAKLDPGRALRSAAAPETQVLIFLGGGVSPRAAGASGSATLLARRPSLRDGRTVPLRELSPCPQSSPTARISVAALVREFAPCLTETFKRSLPESS